MPKIILTDNIVADARDKGIRITDMLAETYADDIADRVKGTSKNSR